MTTRQLWQNIMHYGQFDRMPVMHWGGWQETHRRWIAEGLPADTEKHDSLEPGSEHDYFNAQPLSVGVGVDIGLLPTFEEVTIEETDEYRIYQDAGGVILQAWKEKSCIPHYIDFKLKDASGWGEYKKRLQPNPGRIQAKLDQEIARAEASGVPISINTGSLIGSIRNWMGVKNLAYLCYDARDVLTDMVDTMSDLSCWGLDQVLPKLKVDTGWGWEDICFRSGPLVSPEIFKECVLPGYRKIADKLLSYGVDLYVVDCDGCIDDLLPLWLEAGVNTMFPIEIGAWKADPHAFRKKYGKELRIIGGIGKLEIGKGPAAIDAEIARRLPLMKEGGFIPLPDHLITPDTSLENYKYYLEQIRQLRF